MRFHGIDCVHGDEWCACTEINVLVSQNEFVKHYMNAKAMQERWGDDPWTKINQELGPKPETNAIFGGDRGAGGGAGSGDPSDPGSGAGA